jgi:hypothetical protein
MRGSRRSRVATRLCVATLLIVGTWAPTASAQLQATAQQVAAALDIPEGDILSVEFVAPSHPDARRVTNL